MLCSQKQTVNTRNESGVEMQITATMVKELRGRTGSGMMECKKALTESAGDMEAAVGQMRKLPKFSLTLGSRWFAVSPYLRCRSFSSFIFSLKNFFPGQILLLSVIYFIC